MVSWLAVESFEKMKYVWSEQAIRDIEHAISDTEHSIRDAVQAGRNAECHRHSSFLS